MFSWPLMPKSPRMVPGAALRELVTPVMARTTSTASLPSRQMTITVVLAQDFLVKLHHLQAGDFEAFALETVENLADEAALDGAGFEDNEGFFHVC